MNWIGQQYDWRGLAEYMAYLTAALLVLTVISGTLRFIGFEWKSIATLAMGVLAVKAAGDLYER